MHYCRPLDFDHPTRDTAAAAKRLADLDAAAPRTVRLIYFLPSDRPYRPGVVDSMKTVIGQVQSFYARQLRSHGYNDRTFRIETDAGGEPLVHRVDGRHPDSHYLTHEGEAVEVAESFDFSQSVYLIVSDNSSNLVGAGSARGKGGRKERNSGSALVSADFDWVLAAHELGHAFGLPHDFRDDSYLMSYGRTRNRLSACSAGFLAVHPYFLPGAPAEETTAPAVELLSLPEYPAGSKTVPVRLEIQDAEGLQQVSLFVTTREPHSSAGFFEVKACRKLSGKRAVAEFDFDGVVPSALNSGLADSVAHKVRVSAVDINGNRAWKAVVLWQNSPNQIAALRGHSDLVSSLSFAPDGKTLASASKDRTVKLWDLGTRTPTATLEFDDSWGELAFSPNGRTLASGTYTSIELRDLLTGEITSTLKHEGWVSVAFSPDGGTLASRSYTSIKLWDLGTRTNTISMRRRKGRFASVALSPDGTTLAAGSVDGMLYLWDLNTGQLSMTFEGHRGRVSWLTFSPDSQLLASGAYATVRVWEAASGINTATLAGHGTNVSSLAFSPDGAILASASDRAIRLWDVGTEEVIATFMGHEYRVTSVKFSPLGGILASAALDGTLRLWDVSEWIRPIPHRLVEISGDDGRGWTGSRLEDPFVVSVRDRNGRGLENVAVTFSVTAGSGKLREKFAVEKVTTAAGGRAECFLTLGPNPGINRVEAKVPGLGQVIFEAAGVGIPVFEDDLQTRRVLDDGTIRLGKGRIGLGDRAVAVSPDGRGLAVASGTGIWLYDAALRGPPLLRLPAGEVHSLAFSPGGTLLAAGGPEGGSVELWHVDAGQRIADIGPGSGCVAFAPDGTTLAFGSPGGAVGLWDVAAGTDAGTLEGHSGLVHSLAFSPDGATLASGSADKSVRLWDVGTGTNTAILPAHRDAVNSVAFSPDGRTLASGSDRSVELWDAAAGTNTATLLVHRGGVRSVAFSPDGSSLACGSEGGAVLLWDLASRSAETFSGHTAWINSVAFFPDGTRLVSGSADGAVRLWDVATGSSSSLEGHAGKVASVSFSPDGATLASGSENSVLLWDLGTGGTSSLEGHSAVVRSVAISPDGRTLASGSEDNSVKLWDLGTGKNTVTLHNHLKAVTSVAFSPGGALLVSASEDQTVRLWDSDGANLITLYWTSVPALSVAVSDDTTVAVGLDNGFVKVWDARRKGNGLRGSGGAAHSVAISPGGSILASGSEDGTVRLWDLDVGSAVTFSGHTAAVRSVAFSPDGTALASASHDGRVKLWDVPGKEIISTLEWHAGSVNSVAFSPDGTSLACGLQDGGILLLDTRLHLHPGIPAKPPGIQQDRQRELLLQQNAPNPFNSHTVIPYVLLSPGPARLEIFALTGQRVAVLRRGDQKAGSHRLHWDGRDSEGRPLASGIYLYRLVTPEGVRTRKLTLLR
ncbi:MAG: T9SS type A sorting domain-containing protein [Gemmatimonadetes bacterium]|nr:T9SS type A sorting domain-containing protein [Gemmatimonadota bacterium]